MNNTVKLLIILAVIIGLYFLTIKDTSSTSFDKNFTQLDKDKITKVEIFKTDTVILLKENNEWRVENYKANQSVVDNALKEVAHITLSRKVSSNPKKHDTYEVTSEKGVQIKLSGEQDVAFILGKSGASYQNIFIRRPNEDDVYTTTKNFKFHFNKSANDFKDKTILKIAKNDIASLSINDNLFITNKDSLVTIKSNKGNEIEGNSTAESLLNAFNYFNTLDFPTVDASTLSAEFTVKVHERDGDVQDIRFYKKPSDETKYLVLVNKNQTVFEVNTSSFNSFTKSFNDLKK